MKLIDKDALVAEIERLIEEIYAGRPFDSLSSEQQTALWYVKSIMSSVYILKVKEVDLEKEYKDFVEEDSVYNKLVNGIVGKAIAKHFFELGLKAQKEK